jgi:hypothetical protein
MGLCGIGIGINLRRVIDRRYGAFQRRNLSFQKSSSMSFKALEQMVPKTY